MNDSMTLDRPEAPMASAGSSRPRIAVLGAGPAGLGAAWRLAHEGRADVQVLEGAPRVGGNAGSFELEGVWCDYGSHRLHPVADPRVLADIKQALGDDLLLRPRHGRIRLKERWIHFPLKPVDLALRLPKPFAASLVFDALTAKFRPPRHQDTESFASVLEAGLGRAMCESFYFPYVRKLWGLEPSALAPTLAQRRVSGSSITKLAMKVLRTLPGLSSPTTGKFHYPRRGFGMICDRLHEKAAEAGARFSFRQRVTGIDIEGGRVRAVTTSGEGGETRHEADAVWSTLPITTLVRAAGEAAPASVREAAQSISFRGMILVYIVLETDQFTEFDAHYFPESAVPISRLSEPKNYSASREPSGLTVLCAELPADPGDEHWQMDDEALGKALCGWLESAGLPVHAPLRRSLTRRLAHAYPVYDQGYEAAFETMDRWVSGIDGLLTFGRQGLFAHDNTHHALAMAYAAVASLRPDGSLDPDAWARHRQEFLSHVVED